MKEVLVAACTNGCCKPEAKASGEKRTNETTMQRLQRYALWDEEEHRRRGTEGCMVYYLHPEQAKEWEDKLGKLTKAATNSQKVENDEPASICTNGCCKSEAKASGEKRTNETTMQRLQRYALWNEEEHRRRGTEGCMVYYLHPEQAKEWKDKLGKLTKAATNSQKVENDEPANSLPNKKSAPKSPLLQVFDMVKRVYKATTWNALFSYFKI